MAEQFAQRIEQYRQRVNSSLEGWLDKDHSAPERLRSAMCYAVLGPGKRVRPLLTYAAAELLELAPQQADPIAVAVELVHAYSLVHDDLPAMDDDELRRGRPTTHRAYDEATAILAGDALQALAFQVLVEHPALDGLPQARVALVATLARAVGPGGMVGGQVMDLAAEGKTLEVKQLETLHMRKTGQLIRAAVLMPLQYRPERGEIAEPLERFAARMGLAFQVRDDLLETEQDTETLGKSSHSDEVKHKSTYPRLMGVDDAHRRADELYQQAMKALSELGSGTEGLRWLCDYIVHRTH